jgi:flagellar protein FlbD
MIELHRLGAGPAPFHLNPDLIVTVEATPDTTISLTTGTKVMVVEGVEVVVARIKEWRAGILAGAYTRSSPSIGVLAR